MTCWCRWSRSGITRRGVAVGEDARWVEVDAVVARFREAQAAGSVCGEYVAVVVDPVRGRFVENCIADLSVWPQQGE